MKKINYQLRPATEADYQYCYDLLKQNMFELFSRHWGGWKPDAFRQDFCAANTTIVTMEGRDIGYFSLKKTDAGLYLENIQLSPSVQGQGIGTVILKRILQNHASEPIDLTTFTDNRAMHLYERLGFEVTGREGETIRMLKPVDRFSDSRN
ncbi:MAG: GNAT family N-acetyltransferase [Phormidesmis sp.]